jgi:hypothetical protein
MKFLKSQEFLSYLVFLGMGVVSVFLCITASKDWWVYKDFFNNDLSINTSWQEMWQSFSIFKEPLYFFAAKYFGALISFPAFVAFSTITLLVLKMHFLTKIVGHVWLACFFYSCLYLFLLEGTEIRVAYATACVIPAFYFLNKNNFLISLVLVLTATQLHLTAFVFLLMYPVYFFPLLTKIIAAVFLFSPLAIFIDFSFYDILFDFVGNFTDKYQVYLTQKNLDNQNSTGLFLYFIGFFYLLIIGVFYSLRDSLWVEPIKRVLFSLAMLGVVSMSFLNDHVAVAARFGELFLISIVPLLCWLVIYFKENNMILMRNFIFTTFLLYGMARFVYLFPTLIFD